MPVSGVISVSDSRLARKRAKTRDALVAAARGLFARQGFEATTIAGIAGAADLGFGTFYRYFPDKESILRAVLDAGRAEIDQVLIAADLDGAAAAEALARLTAGFAQAVRRNHDVLSLMWQVGVRAEVPGALAIGSHRLPPERSLPVMLAAALRRIIERGIAAGEFAAADAVLLSRFIAGAHMYLLTSAASETDEATLIDTLCAFELRALAAAGTAAPLRKDPRTDR